jgi:hypothetical protein
MPLRVVAGSSPKLLTRPDMRKEWKAVADHLWSAWRSLEGTEQCLTDTFGPHFGTCLVVLWTISRIGGCSLGDSLLTELLDDETSPLFFGGSLNDIAEASFALGVAFARAEKPAREKEDLVLKVLDGDTPTPKAGNA